MSDIDDDFVDNFNDEEDQDAKLAEETENKEKSKGTSLEKRRLIDKLLEEKRLARELQDELDDDFDEDFDDDFGDE